VHRLLRISGCWSMKALSAIFNDHLETGRDNWLSFLCIDPITELSRGGGWTTQYHSSIAMRFWCGCGNDSLQLISTWPPLSNNAKLWLPSGIRGAPSQTGGRCNRGLRGNGAKSKVANGGEGRRPCALCRSATDHWLPRIDEKGSSTHSVPTSD
jgi:hypothetical protein